MNEKKGSRPRIIRSMLSVLVEEWGIEIVRSELERLIADNRDSVLGGARESNEVGGVGRGGRSTEKPTATMLAAKISLPPAQKQLIHTLAIRFDNKRFLPTAGDIKDFFEVHGEAAPSPKQRIETFRRILRLLSSLPESSLRNIIENEAHSGPSSLTPLSEAIRDVGAQRVTREIDSLDGSLTRDIDDPEAPLKSSDNKNIDHDSR